MNVGEIGDGVRRVQDMIDEGHGAADAAAAFFERAGGILDRMLATTGRREAVAAVEALAASVARAEAASALAVEATVFLDAWLHDAGVPSHSSTGMAGGERDQRSGDVPPSVARLAEGMRPWRDSEQTFGRADIGNERVEFASGRRRDARAGLRPEYGGRTVVIDHVEGHVAARMREPEAPRHIRLVINKDPCPGVMGCDATLPAILPVGSSVSIYVVGENGVYLYGTYHGTGEGIA